MIPKLKELFNPHGPRSFAGCVVFCALLACAFLHRAYGYNYRFDGGGGTVNGNATCTVTGWPYAFYSTQGLALAHTNASLRCVGWYSAGYVVKFCDVGGILANMGSETAYAKWVEDRYPILYVANIGQSQTNSQWVTASTSVTLAANSFKRSNHRFLGWSLDASASAATWSDGQSGVNLDLHRDYNDFTHVDDDGNPVYPVTLYAVWGRQFTLEFERNGGSGSMKDQILNDGESTNLNPCTFTPPTGHKFKSWTSDTIGSYRDGDEITYRSSEWKGTTATLTAKWTPIVYAVRFAANSPVPVSGTMSDMEMEYGSSQHLTKCAFTRTGYEFRGWSRSSGGEVEFADGEEVLNLSATDAAVVTLYAQWSPISYTVRFDGNGGSGEMADLDCEYDRSCRLPDNRFSLTGGTFLGWTTNGSAQVVYADGATVSNLTATADSTVTLKAVWSNIRYRIVFDANGGSGSVAAMDCEYGGKYALPANGFVRTGYLCEGWATNSATAAVYREGEVVSNLTQVADSSVRLYAAWRPIKYVVTFDANGGEGAMPPQTNVYDTVCQLASNAFTRLGRVFSGWATNASGAAVYADGASVSNLVAAEYGEYPLYAVWTKALGELNAALDNDDLIMLKDDAGCSFVSVVDDATAVNGSCARIDGVKGNDGTLGFRVYLEEPGELTFSWRIVNEYSGFHWDPWWVKVYCESGAATNSVLNVYGCEDLPSKRVAGITYVDTPDTEWADVKVSVSNAPAALHFVFPFQSKMYSSDINVRFDNVRWSAGLNPEPTAGDAPVIQGAAAIEGGRFRVTFTADHRFKYELIRNGTLEADRWESFDPRMFLSPATDGSVSFEPAIDASEDCMFYRVKVLKRD